MSANCNQWISAG